jgi:hypothetical protein
MLYFYFDFDFECGICNLLCYIYIINYNYTQMNRAMQKSFLTGMNGTYATNTVKGTNELFDTNGFNNVNNNVVSNNNGITGNSNGGDYNRAYLGGTNGNVFIGQPDYTNPHNTIHDNIGESTLLEQTFDNKIFIDSSFKDYSKHPDPFKFIVKFNGTEAKTETVYVMVDGNTYSYRQYLSGDVDIVFDRIFKNIKYVVINALILPNYITFKTKEDGSYFPDEVRVRDVNKYILLKINELKNGRYFSNNPSFGRESFVMKRDSDLCINNHIWIPIHNCVSYFDSQLKLVDRLTVEICNDKGVRLCPKLDGNPHDFFADYRKTIDKVMHLQSINTPDAMRKINKLQPKLESLKLITEYLAPELHLSFNTLEPQIDTKPQFRF